jgi:hypothetical protein
LISSATLSAASGCRTRIGIVDERLKADEHEPDLCLIVRAVVADSATGLAPKRNEAVKAAGNLAADERSAMYRLLEQDVAARPSERLQEEILKSAETPEDVERILKEQALVSTSSCATILAFSGGSVVVLQHSTHPRTTTDRTAAVSRRS